MTLADSLPSGGRINGYQIATIITRAMHGGYERRP